MTDEFDSTPGESESDAILVRTLRADDLEAIVAIDAAASGRERPRYFELMLQRALEAAHLQVSLVAESDDAVSGFLICSLYYGEFGIAEPSASIDAISVHPEYRGRGIGQALLRQLRLNMGALRIETLRTEVAWNDFDLLGFFQKEGFRPADRICLDHRLDPTAPDEGRGG